MAGALPRVVSVRDDRPVPLFPCFCGDDGSTNALPVGKWRREHFPNGDGRCGYSSGDVCLDFLDCVPMALRRLGPDSRALVMSLYRAIVERFYIMRATGCEEERPAGPSGFCFGGVLVACNCSPDKRAFAGGNRRRAFGGFFRDTFRKFVQCAYCRTADAVQSGSVRFYPFTAFVCGAFPGVPFVPGARDLSGDASLPEWGNGFICWQDILGRCRTGSPLGSPWTVDNSRQADLQGRRQQPAYPLWQDFSAAYAQYGFPDASGLNDWMQYYLPRETLDRDDARSSWQGRCVSFGGSVRMDCRLALAFAECAFPGGCVGTRFSLPALALALRMLSVMNAQTVSRPEVMSIPHKKVCAQYVLHLGIADDGTLAYSESSDFHVDYISCTGRVVLGAGLSYLTEGTAGTRDGSVFYNLDDRDPPSRDDPAYYCIGPACWSEWGKYIRWCNNGGSSSDSYATFSATVPDLSARESCIVAFGGPAYPARWAVLEGDVGFGAVSAFVWDSCGNQMWTASQDASPASALGSCKDLMGVLARRLVKAAGRRLESDVDADDPPQGNTFSGADGIPTSRSAVEAEAVGESHADNLAALDQAVLAFNENPPQLSGRYSFLRLHESCGGSGISSVTGHESADDPGMDIVPDPDVPHSGTWLNLASIPGESVHFTYASDYRWCGDRLRPQGQGRRGWKCKDRSIQFGGFFGHFIFNNRAARQVS